MSKSNTLDLASTFVAPQPDRSAVPVAVTLFITPGEGTQNRAIA